MNKTEAKKIIKEWGIYTALYDLAQMRYNEATDLLEIIERVLDNIPQEILKKAIRKGCK